MDNFLKQDALGYQEQKTAITYLCTWKDTFVAYMTVCADCVRVKDKERMEIEKRFPHGDFPSLKIARLLVDKNFRGREIGTYMVLQATKLALRLSDSVGL